MSNSHLNLARAWRSKTFDEIIGQELAVRMVKNGLFKNQLFPVYLIAGQRGCGKTTLGRVFAAAINCERCEEFVKNPRDVVLPCLTCVSCQAMRAGEHPDFFEIDAASHTGVDNVRSLIESASLIPGLGRKKIYLIDEAHMLSKAAFNAFLKILEEPPKTVLFMLATTDPHKIIDTVRSRCFQLFLNPLDPKVLSAYLARICTEEGIEYDEAALMLIAHESEGSVRDALNILERLRLAYGVINHDNVLKTLGDIGYNHLLMLCECAFSGSPERLVACLDELQIKRFSPVHIWKKMIDVLRALVWVHSGNTSELLTLYEQEMRALVQKVTMNQLVAAMELWYEAEPLFNKTNAQHALIEMLFTRMALPQPHNRGPQSTQKIATGGSAIPTKGPTSGVALESSKVQKEASSAVVEQARTDKEMTAPGAAENLTGPWYEFIRDLATHDDPLVLSVFKQGSFIVHEDGHVHVVFAEHLSFFKELIDQTRGTWQPLLSARFGINSTLKPEFKGASVRQHNSKQAAQPVTPLSESAAHISASRFEKQTSSRSDVQQPRMSVQPVRQRIESQHSVGPRIDLKDPERFKKVKALLTVFPGSVTEEKESINE
jgi:DNA polymerase-3 subunit gamma/tau